MKTPILSAWILAIGLLWTPVGAQEVASQSIEEITGNTSKMADAVLTKDTLSETKREIQKKIEELKNELNRDGYETSGRNIYIAPSTDTFISVAVGSDDARVWKWALVKKN